MYFHPCRLSVLFQVHPYLKHSRVETFSPVIKPFLHIAFITLLCLTLHVSVCVLFYHWPVEAVAMAADGLGDGGGEGRMWRVKWLLGLVAPIRLTRHLKIGFSIPDGPFQSSANWHEGMTALAFLLISSTEHLDICRVKKNMTVHYCQTF